MKIVQNIFSYFVGIVFVSICFAQISLVDIISSSRMNEPNVFYKTYSNSDDNLKEKIITKLRENGFTNVQVEVLNEGVVILRGTVPKGKMFKVIELVSELKPSKIENQLTEEG